MKLFVSVGNELGVVMGLDERTGCIHFEPMSLYSWGKSVQYYLHVFIIMRFSVFKSTVYQLELSSRRMRGEGEQEKLGKEF